MKKLFIAILLAGLFAVSCNIDPLTLDGTTWSVVAFEDIFDGSVVHQENVDGYVDAEAYGENLDLYLSIPALGLDNDRYTPDDYSIVRSTSHELVIDLWYYEYDDYDESDCEFIEKYKGRKMYYAYYNYAGQLYYDIVYFVGHGISVDCGYEEPENGRPYYYDTTRIYCRR